MSDDEDCDDVNEDDGRGHDGDHVNSDDIQGAIPPNFQYQNEKACSANEELFYIENFVKN